MAAEMTMLHDIAVEPDVAEVPVPTVKAGLAAGTEALPIASSLRLIT